MTEDTANNAPEASESWYSERQARLESERARIDAQTGLIEASYGNLQSRWAELERQENDAHDMIETREILRIQGLKQQLQAEASQLQSGYHALQQERSQIDRVSSLDYNTS